MIVWIIGTVALGSGLWQGCVSVELSQREAALLHAVMQSDLQDAKRLISSGAEPDMRNVYTPLKTPLLMYAVSADNSKEMTNLLLSSGADPNANNLWGQTAIMSAAGHGQSDVVKLLLKFGADPLLKDDYGESALNKAVDSGEDEVANLIRKFCNQVRN